MTLQLLFDVPMSLSDKHFLTPKNIVSFLNGTGKKIVKMVSVDNEVTQGNYFAKDMRKRLTNALSDASLPNDKVELFSTVFLENTLFILLGVLIYWMVFNNVVVFTNKESKDASTLNDYYQNVYSLK